MTAARANKSLGGPHDQGGTVETGNRHRSTTNARRPKIKSYFFISLDGIVESPDKWHFPCFNDEMGADVRPSFGNVGA